MSSGYSSSARAPSRLGCWGCGIANDAATPLRRKFFEDLANLAGGIVLPSARYVESHHRSIGGRVGRPVGQPLVIRMASARERGPTSRGPGFQLMHARLGWTYHAFAHVNVVEHEWNLDRVRRTQMHHRRFPREHI